MTEPLPLKGVLYERLVHPYLGRIFDIIKDERMRNNIKALLHDHLEGATSRLGIVHGDFSVTNIIVNDGKISGVIDWEDVAYSAPPILDAFNYLDSLERARNKNASLAQTIPLLAWDDWSVVEEQSFLNNFFQFCGIDTRNRQGFALLYWLYHVGPQLTIDVGNNASEWRIKLESVLTQFLEK